MGVHDGHRERLKQHFETSGLDGLADHEVLELLLFFALPRGDVNPIAHHLIDKFGSLSAVFDAPEEELLTVSGIGENAARLLKILPQVARRYRISRTEMIGILDTPATAGKYLQPYFFAEKDEVVYIVCLDQKKKVLACRPVFRGNVNAAIISVRKIIEAALLCNATSVILAHNHPSGIALPSQEDMDTTKRIEAALDTVGIELADHIIIADGDFVSMAESGFLRMCR